MATANFGKIQIGIYVEIKRSDGERRRRPGRPGPAVGCAAEGRGRRPPAAPLIAPPGCGGGKAAAAALLCVACVLVRSARGAPSVPPQCRGLGAGGWAGGGRRGRPGCRGPSLWGRGAGSRAGAPRFSRDLHPPWGLQSGVGMGLRSRCGMTHPRASPGSSHFPASSPRHGGWGGRGGE